MIINGDPDRTNELLNVLQRQVISRSAVIGVVGLGYVGLPLACTIADNGFRVIGLDRDKERVRALQRRVNPIGGEEPGLSDLLAAVTDAGSFRATHDYRELAAANLITINVDTPIGQSHQPNDDSLIAACQSLSEVVTSGVLVIVESTVSPGTTNRIVGPILEKGSGLTIPQDLFLGACPERVMPGKLLANLRHVPRVCGGVTPDVARTMRLFYSAFVDADLDETDTAVAEFVKVAENTYRDVQIAFANEVSLICEDLGIDVWQVRELVNKVPYRDMHRPGGGVGGHCLPKDPWLLAAAADINLRVIPAARAVNDEMPHHVAKNVRAEIEAWRLKVGMEAALKVAILGLTYLQDSDDTRNSPSIPVIADLQSFGYDVVVHDPHVPGVDGPLSNVVQGCQAVVVMVPHAEYEGLSLDAPIVVRIGKRA